MVRGWLRAGGCDQSMTRVAEKKIRFRWRFVEPLGGGWGMVRVLLMDD